MAYSLFPPRRPPTARRVGSLPLLNADRPRQHRPVSEIDSLPVFDSDTLSNCIDSFFKMGSFDQEAAADRLYFCMQPSQESLVPSNFSRQQSVLLPECDLVKSYPGNRGPAPDKPLPPTPLQPHQRVRKRSNRSVTPSQLQQLSRNVSPNQPSIERSSPPSMHDSFNPSDGIMPTMGYVLGSTRPRSSNQSSSTKRLSNSHISPKAMPNRPPSARARRRPSEQKLVSSPTSSPMPVTIHLSEAPGEQEMAYVPMEYVPIVPAQHKHSFSDPFEAFDGHLDETSGWEPDSDDEKPSRVLRKKFSSKFPSMDRTARASTSRPSSSMGKRPSSSGETVKKHSPRVSNGSTASTVSCSSTLGQRVSQSTADSSFSQSTTLLRNSTAASSVEDGKRDGVRLISTPSIAAMPGKKKVKFSRRLKSWLRKSS